MRLVEGDRAHIHYTSDSSRAASDSVVVRCNPSLYCPETRCKVHVRGPLQIWEDARATDNFDIIGGSWRLLTLQDEWHVPVQARDRRGTFVVSALPTERAAVVGVPLVEFHAEVLGDTVARCWPRLAEAAAPRWPNGKGYALVLSHDADHVHVGFPAEVAVNLAKAALRRSAEHAALGWCGLQHMFRPQTDPFFRFGWWRHWEAQRGLRSVFYLFVRPRGVPADLNDCKSTVADSATDWALFRRMAEDGWEFGLHPSIHARKHPWAFQAAREWLEQRLGSRVVGLRHHYFALDWRRPYETHRMQAEAGFEYDSSIAFRDAPGFRTGTCLPHQPFDPVRNEVIPLQVLPCNLMDVHALCKDITGTREGHSRAVEKGRDLCRVVCQHGGALVFNWHQEVAFNQLIYGGFVDVLEEVLTDCLRESAWIATAEEVCTYWNRKSRELDQDACSVSIPISA